MSVLRRDLAGGSLNSRDRAELDGSALGCKPGDQWVPLLHHRLSV